MRINTLTINNFRSYKKPVTFDLRGENHINVLLGENGSGKTSLLSAIKYVLFGPRMFGSENQTKDYIAWVTREKNMDSNLNYFQIELEFVDINKVVKVNRKSSIMRDGSLSEVCNVTIDGQLQKDNSYLNKLNYNLFNHIFFDGEKISKLTGSKREMNKFIETTLDVYFEIDVFKQLLKDAKLSKRNEYKQNSTVVYASLEKELTTIEKKIGQNESSLQSIDSEIQTNQSNITQLSNEMKKKNIISDEEVKKIQGEVNHLKKEIEEISTEVTKFLKSNLHLLILSEVLVDYKNNLDDTRNERIEKLLKQYQSLSSNNYELDPVLNINEEANILKLASSVSDFDWTNIEQLLKEYISKSNKLGRRQKKLAKSEEGRQMMDLGQNIKFLENEISNLEVKYFDIETKLMERRELRKGLIEDIENERKKMLTDTLVRNSIAEKDKLIDILEQYIDAQSKQVMEGLSKSMMDILSKYILRKNNLVDDIRINDNQIYIIKDKHERLLSSYSAGEQQLFIVAYIFALVSESTIKLPLLLDTFFARLDTSHQNNLLRYISSKLDNQVIFIATDSELTGEKMRLLNPNINVVYSLQNDGYETQLEVKNAFEN